MEQAYSSNYEKLKREDEISDRVEKIQAFMHEAIEMTLNRKSTLRYEDCVTVFLIRKIAELEMENETLYKHLNNL